MHGYADRVPGLRLSFVKALRLLPRPSPSRLHQIDSVDEVGMDPLDEADASIVEEPGQRSRR